MRGIGTTRSTGAAAAGRWVGVTMLAAVLCGLTAVETDAAEKSKRRRWWEGEATREAEPFHHRSRLREGATLAVHGINGSIKAELSNGSEVVVDAVRRGRKDDPEDVKIEVIATEEGLLVCARYPSPSGDLNECDGTQHVQNCDVTVEFTIQVPAGVDFEPRTVNGSIRATGLEGDVDAHTVNGSIEITTSGSAQAHTVNGSIDARLGDLEEDSRLEFETVNGAIEVRMPEDTGVSIEARSSNGSVKSLLPIEVEGRISSRRLTGRIGDGSAHMRLSTVNGSIRLAALE